MVKDHGRAARVPADRDPAVDRPPRDGCSLALPRSLDKALVALGLPIEKDKAGQRLVRSLSKPDRKTGAYPELTPEIVARVTEYNRIDILALEAMHKQGLGR